MAHRLTHIAFSCFSLLLIWLAAAPALSAEADEVARSLGLAAEPAQPTTPFPRPASRIAENHTVITADQIARINAHTVGDVLQTLPGIELNVVQTPGSASFFQILGASARHILVQIDGVPQNFIGSENVAWVGHIPVQMVERIEVVKGAASAAWGSALGGVVNIITKDPAERAVSGMLSASAGKSSTNDLRAEASGSSKGLGYYITGGRLNSDGLVAGNETDLSHGFGKFTLGLPSGGKVTFAGDVRYNRLGLEESRRFNFDNTGQTRHTTGYATLLHPLGERLSLELSTRVGEREIQNDRLRISPALPFFDATGRESFQGGGAGLNWGDASFAVKGGVEYEHTDIRLGETVQRIPQMNYDLTLQRWSGYINGTYTVGRLSILPGVRVDRINLLEDPVSYTLGATLRLTDGTLLRGYASRGYSMPIITTFGTDDGSPDRELQHVRTLQAGVESSEIPYLWLKGTLFYADVWNIQDLSTRPFTRREQVRQGVELEMRSSPFYGVTLTGAYYFVDARDHKTDEKLSSAVHGPRQALKLGVEYVNDAGLTAVFKGNYTKLHDAGPLSKNAGMLWDLHLTQKVATPWEHSAELFLSLRNIFDSEQYEADFRPNAPRWVEAGARYHF